ncbi:Hypothetical predicted protein [Xyrichtys novacula]|uniref:Uncharacterized protein n=1 Tax=Xyrichtys novacula TaxID=13765 RepID=A0AAV1GIK0_XYRNO|nr:Hypothetical predicted protein [Xyrichtys novacula]
MWVRRVFIQRHNVIGVYIYQTNTEPPATPSWITPDTLTDRRDDITPDYRRGVERNQTKRRAAISQIKANTASEANSQLTVTTDRGWRTRGALDWMMSRSPQELAADLINL